MMMKITHKIIFILLFVIVYFVSFERVQFFRKNLPQEFQRADTLMVSPLVIKIAAPDFQGLISDYLHIRASIFLGGTYKRTMEDWETLNLIYRQIIELDPYFFQTVYYAQGFLAWRNPMQKKAIEILETIEKARTWDWRPAFYIGFDYYYFLNEKLKAVEHLGIASHRPNAPLITTTLRARLAQESGDSDTAIAFLQTLYADTQDETLREQLKKRIQAHIGIQIIEGAIKRYIGDNNTTPLSLHDLQLKGYIDVLPENPFGDTFYYNSATNSLTYLPQGKNP
jgi:hypothetical protein